MPRIYLTGATAQARLRYGRLVQPAREAIGMTKQDLAEAADVSRNTVTNVEAGKGAPQEEVLRRIFTVLDIQTDLDAEHEGLEARMEVLTRLAAHLLPEDQEEAIGAMETLLTIAIKNGRVGGTGKDAINVTPITGKSVEDMTVDELEAEERRAATDDDTEPQEYPEG